MQILNALESGIRAMRLKRCHGCRYRGYRKSHETGRNHLDPAFWCQIAKKDQIAMSDEGQNGAHYERRNRRPLGDLLAKDHR